MPKLEKLSTEEVERLTKRRQVNVDLAEYTEFLDALKSGDWAALTVQENESQRTVKRRLTMAAKAKGLAIKYRKSDNGRLVFQVEGTPEPEPTEETEPTEKSNRRDNKGRFLPS